MISHTFRLKPGQDLTHELHNYIHAHQITAASISTCVGSLLKCSIRFANIPEYNVIEGHYEIVSMVGTLSVYGYHIHLSVSDGNGNMIGGHLPMSDNECIVYTTAEIVLLEHVDSVYLRMVDPTYGYEELFIV